MNKLCSNFYFVPSTNYILHIEIYEDDSALVWNGQTKKAMKWDSEELYTFLELFFVFGIEFIGEV